MTVASSNAAATNCGPCEYSRPVRPSKVMLSCNGYSQPRGLSNRPHMQPDDALMQAWLCQFGAGDLHELRLDRLPFAAIIGYVGRITVPSCDV